MRSDNPMGGVRQQALGAPTPTPRHSTQSNKATAPSQWIPTQDPNLTLRTTAPKANFELQQIPRANSDSGHNSSQSSPSSPSSSLMGKKETSLEPLSKLPPLPLSASKPRRPRSQHLGQDKPTKRQSIHAQSSVDLSDSRQYGQSPGPQELANYRVDNITYADLDPKAFMRPENRVLPSSGLIKNQKSTYAKIDVSRSQLV